MFAPDDDNYGPATTSFRVDNRNPGHVRLSVFIGKTPGSRGHSGQLILRVEDFNDLLNDEGDLVLEGVVVDLSRDG